MTTASDRSAPGRKGGEVARIAARWCRDPGFQRWIDERSGRRRRAVSDVTLTQAEAMARVLVLVACGIGSRVELDHDEAAATRFDALIRRPYLAHLATQQVPEAKRMATALAGRMDAWLAGQLGQASSSLTACNRSITIRTCSPCAGQSSLMPGSDRCGMG